MKHDDLLTKVLSCDFMTAMSHMRMLYDYRVNRRVEACVCSLREAPSTSSRFLVLVLRDNITNRWIGLRLPTFRKVVKFISAKKLLASRRLTTEERERVI